MSCLCVAVGPAADSRPTRSSARVTLAAASPFGCLMRLWVLANRVRNRLSCGPPDAWSAPLGTGVLLQDTTPRRGPGHDSAQCCHQRPHLHQGEAPCINTARTCMQKTLSSAVLRGSRLKRGGQQICTSIVRYRYRCTTCTSELLPCAKASRAARRTSGTPLSRAKHTDSKPQAAAPKPRTSSSRALCGSVTSCAPASPAPPPPPRAVGDSTSRRHLSPVVIFQASW